MRLIGGKDYYDSAAAYGSDPSVVFVREKAAYSNALPLPEEYYWSLYDTPECGWNRKHFGKFSIEPEPIIIYVAGITYHGVKLNITANGYSPGYVCFYDYEELKAFLANHGAYMAENRKSFYSEKKTIKEHMEQPSENKQMDLCIEHGITVATLVRNPEQGKDKEFFAWRINGDNLHNFEFFKRLDPYACYQEISMYVGGVLPKPGSSMVEITDQKIKAQKHGFDKWSFRTKGVNSV